MDNKKRTEKKHDVSSVRKYPRLNWKVVATVVTVVAGLLGIADKLNRGWQARHVPVVETRFVLVKSGCLKGFLQDSQGASPKWQITNPAFIPSHLFQEVHRASDPTISGSEGETVKSATFLVLKNITNSQFNIILKNGAVEHRANNVLPSNTVVYCVRVNHKGGITDEDEPIDKVIVQRPSGGERTILPGKIPAESEMSVVDDCFDAGYPPR